MLKLKKKIDLLTKNEKSVINQNTDAMTIKVKERWVVLRWGGCFGGAGCFQ